MDGNKFEWDDAGDDVTTILFYDGYWAEVDEIDNTYSITIREDDPVDGEVMYHREDIDCLNVAQEIAELVIELASLKSKNECLKKDCDKYYSKYCEAVEDLGKNNKKVGDSIKKLIDVQVKLGTQQLELVQKIKMLMAENLQLQGDKVEGLNGLVIARVELDEHGSIKELEIESGNMERAVFRPYSVTMS